MLSSRRWLDLAIPVRQVDLCETTASQFAHQVHLDVHQWTIFQLRFNCNSVVPTAAQFRLVLSWKRSLFDGYHGYELRTNYDHHYEQSQNRVDSQTSLVTPVQTERISLCGISTGIFLELDFQSKVFETSEIGLLQFGELVAQCTALVLKLIVRFLVSEYRVAGFSTEIVMRTLSTNPFTTGSNRRYLR